jgi:acyl-CoA thioester hydrolase
MSQISSSTTKPIAPVAVKITPHRRRDYCWFTDISTRWADNDVYGHINNVVYYAFFDTAVNQFLIKSGVLDIHAGLQIGLVIETGCNYFSPLAFPEQIVAGIRVTKLGSSSVRYEVALFANDSDTAAAQGHFVHVYVNKATRRPEPLQVELRVCLKSIFVEPV